MGLSAPLFELLQQAPLHFAVRGLRGQAVHLVGIVFQIVEFHPRQCDTETV